MSQYLYLDKYLDKARDNYRELIVKFPIDLLVELKEMLLSRNYTGGDLRELAKKHNATTWSVCDICPFSGLACISNFTDDDIQKVFSSTMPKMREI